MKKYRKLEKMVRHQIEYVFVLCFVMFLRQIPRRTGIMLMKMCVLVFYFLAKEYRTITIRNLKRAFGDEKSEKEIKQIARNVFLHFAAAGVDVIRIPVYIKQETGPHITTKNIHYLEKARDDAKGFILLTGHFGNWELMGTWLAQRNYHLHVIAAALSNSKVNKIIVDMRNQAGYINIARGKTTRAIFAALKNGYPLALLIDQDTRVKGVFVDFFGMKAHTPTGPAVLAGKFNVPIIPMAMHLKKDLTYEIECFEPIVYTDTGDKEADIITATQKCSDIYEQIIRKHPEQWAWMHRRWKKQPGDTVKKFLYLPDRQADDIQQSVAIGFQSR